MTFTADTTPVLPNAVAIVAVETLHYSKSWGADTARVDGETEENISTDLNALADQFLTESIFAPGDRDEFIDEIRSAVVSGSFEALGTVLRHWKETGDALRDPETREILFGDFDVSDFVEVERP